VEADLQNILKAREKMATAYLTIASAYNIPIDFFGEKVEFLMPEKSGNEMALVRAQILDYLHNKMKKDEEGLPWSTIYGRTPDIKLRLAIGMETLRDILTSKLSLVKDIEKAAALLEDIWVNLNKVKNKEEILKSWGEKTCKKLLKTPYSKDVESEILKFSKNSYSCKEDLWGGGETLITYIRTWEKTNAQTMTRRIELVQKEFPDFDPGSKKWQRILINRAATDGIDLKALVTPPRDGLTKLEEESQSLGFDMKEGITIIGLHHGSPKNIDAISFILKEIKTKGYTILTLEEPKDTGWMPYMEFAQSLGPKRKISPRTLSQKSRDFCHIRGVENQSTIEKLVIIHLAKELGYKIEFIDIKFEKKKEDLDKRKWEFLSKVVQGPKLNVKDPITAVGGSKIWSENLLKTYAACKERSHSMAENIAELSKDHRIVHIGGNLHLLDIKERLEERGVSGVRTLSLESSRDANPITDALGKRLVENKQYGNFLINIDKPYKERLKSLLNSKSKRENQTMDAAALNELMA
jgi:hypothetical protein